MSKRELEILLSQLSEFAEPKVGLEQYPTDAATAADALWHAKSNGHIVGKTLADLGCGPGIFGIGALLLGAKFVYFVDVDADALAVCKQNVQAMVKVVGRNLRCAFHEVHVKDFSEDVDVVLQNPPFGVKRSHHDKLFLVRALELADVVYTFHKLSTEDFVKKVVRDSGFVVRRVYRYRLPIKRQFFFHFSRVREVEVGCWLLTRT